MAKVLYTEFSTAKTAVENAWRDIYQNTNYGWTTTVTSVAQHSKATAASVLELGNKIASTDADAAAGAKAAGRCDANLTADYTGQNTTYYRTYKATYYTTNYGGFRGSQEGYDTYRKYNANNY